MDKPVWWRMKRGPIPGHTRDNTRARFAALFAIEPRLHDTEIAHRVGCSREWVRQVRKKYFQLDRVRAAATKPYVITPGAFRKAMYRALHENGYRHCPGCHGVFCFDDWGSPRTFYCRACNTSFVKRRYYQLKRENPELLRARTKKYNDRLYQMSKKWRAAVDEARRQAEGKDDLP